MIITANPFSPFVLVYSYSTSLCLCILNVIYVRHDMMYGNKRSAFT